MTRSAMIVSFTCLAGAAPAWAAESPAPAVEPPPVAAGTALGAALATLEAGDLASGCAQLQVVATRYTPSPEATWARQMAVTLAKLSPGACTWARPGVGAIEQDGSTELIVSQAVVGPAWFGSALPIWVDDTGGTTPPVLLAFVGLGLGIGGTYYGARAYRPTQGQAMAIYTGELLGGWYGMWLTASQTEEGRLIAQAGHAGVLVGGLGGLAVASSVKPGAGDMALVRSGAVWGTWYGGLILLGVQADSGDVLTGLGVGTTVGVGAGAGLAATLDLRRGQVNTVNLGGYAGTLVGGGVALILGESLQPGGAAVVMGTGTTAGLVAGSLLIRREIKTSPAVARFLRSPALPTTLPLPEGGRVPGVTVQGVW